MPQTLRRPTDKKPRIVTTETTVTQGISVCVFDIRNLVVRSVESGEERTYKSPDWTNVSYGFGPGAPKWLRDGNGFFIGDEPILGRSRWLGRMTMEGQFTKLEEIKPELGWVSALSPDDETAYVFSRKDNSPNGAYVGIVAVDLTSGVQKRVFTLPGSGSINSAVVNADGHMLAFFVFSQKDGRNTATLATMQSDGTNYRELYVTAKRVSNVPEQIQWTKDSRALFFLEDGRIMRISVEGRSPEFTGLSSLRPDQQHGMSLRSDGSHIAFTDGAAWSTSKELWALDNLESLLKSSR